MRVYSQERGYCKPLAIRESQENIWLFPVLRNILNDTHCLCNKKLKNLGIFFSGIIHHKIGIGYPLGS